MHDKQLGLLGNTSTGVGNRGLHSRRGEIEAAPGLFGAVWCEVEGNRQSWKKDGLTN